MRRKYDQRQRIRQSEEPSRRPDKYQSEIGFSNKKKLNLEICKDIGEHDVFHVNTYRTRLNLFHIFFTRLFMFHMNYVDQLFSLSMIIHNNGFIYPL